MPSLYKFRNREILNGVLNVKWGITNKLLPEKQEMPEYKNRERAIISTHINSKNPVATKIHLIAFYQEVVHDHGYKN